MKTSEWIEVDLISAISRLCEDSENGSTTIAKLKTVYLPKPQKGVLQGITFNFDRNLAALEREGYISIDGKKITYLKKKI